MHGKISREEVAQIYVAALESPYASGKAFEVTADLCPLIVCCVLWLLKVLCHLVSHLQYPPPEKDYNVYFKTLKDGNTGKEILEQDPVPV
ncbi:unnamed protein product [Prunus armeniaca]